MTQVAVSQGFPGASVAGAFVLGGIAVWAAARIWNGKSLRPWENRSNLVYPQWYFAATLLPGVMFLTADAAFLFALGGHIHPFAIALVFRVLTGLFALAAIGSFGLGVALFFTRHFPTFLTTPRNR
jgi:hypothetical protein